MSPTVFCHGEFRFYFFSCEEPRCYDRVFCPDGEAKFWLEPKIGLAHLVEQLRVSLQAIERFDTRIDVVAQALPNYALFRALPGAGLTYVPRLLAAFGEQRLVETAFLQPARYFELGIFLLASVSRP